LIFIKNIFGDTNNNINDIHAVRLK